MGEKSCRIDFSLIFFELLLAKHKSDAIIILKGNLLITCKRENDRGICQKIHQIKSTILEIHKINWRTFDGTTKQKSNQMRNYSGILAFCAAAELELRLNKADLEFKREYN